MHLIHNCPIITPQFSSLSLLCVDGNSSSENENSSIHSMHEELLLVASPLATTSQRTVLATLSDLHDYLSSNIIYNGNQTMHSRKKPNNTILNSSLHQQSKQTINGWNASTPPFTSTSFVASPLYSDLRKEITDFACDLIQVYRGRHGMGLHYMIIQEPDIVKQCCALLISTFKPKVHPTTNKKNSHSQVKSRKSSSKQSIKKGNKTDLSDSILYANSIQPPNNIVAVVLTVGLAGNASIHVSSSLTYALPKRLYETSTKLLRFGKLYINADERKKHVVSLLSALLVEKDDLQSNWVAGITFDSTTLPSYSIKSTPSLFKSPVQASQTEIEKMQILAISERDMNLKADRTINRSKNDSIDERSSESSSPIFLPDFPGFDYVPPGSTPKTPKNGNKSTSSREQKAKLSISLPIPPPFFKGSSLDTRRKNSSLNALQRRKAEKQRLNNKTKSPNSLGIKIPQATQKEQSYSKYETATNYDRHNEKDDSPHRPTVQKPLSEYRATTKDLSFSLEDSTDWTANFNSFNNSNSADFFTTNWNTTENTEEPNDANEDDEASNDTDTLISKTSSNINEANGSLSFQKGKVKDNSSTIISTNRPPFKTEKAFDTDKQQPDNNSTSTVDTATPSEGSAGTVPTLLINASLNEDLICIYEKGKLYSSAIEGTVQIQTKSDTLSPRPFILAIKDSSFHVQHLKVASEHVRNIPDENEREESRNSAVHKLLVEVPNISDKYFTALRYKCTSELRPVPIRVQTQTRLYGNYCCVALQISSNPANKDELSDLTILMPVPENMKGESLVTSPSGGIWDASKRSVLWRVAKLGYGEKFQLQAQFEILAKGGGNFPPSFPVLVRCQCMHAQLSEIQLEAYEASIEFPAEITLKIARRFRLSHREKP